MSTNDRDGLERRAEEARERLRGKLELLEERGRGLAFVAVQVRSAFRPVAIAMATLLAAGIFAAGATAIAARRRTRRRAALRDWVRPVTEFGRPKRPAVFQEVGRKLLVSALTLAGSRLLRWTADRALSLPASAQTPSSDRPAAIPSFSREVTKIGVPSSL